MLLVVFMSNLFFLMLGWDGLGLVSFFLIVYYQNQSSITSGLFTLLINRLGDCFFLLTIGIYFSYVSSFGFSFTSDYSPFVLVSLLVLTFMTKRALFPFSPWLPLAIAAPTPISALVHSSTLVTAGLYLMMRFHYLVSASLLVNQILLLVCIFTSFYAGINAIFEVDLKKLIALSTLSHLGFIGLAFFSGLFRLAFFHILTHALFKSLLFMSMGDIITNLSHSQDLRFLSSGLNYTPGSCAVMYISLLNLLGLPSLRGFFSKDLVLETLLFSDISYLAVLVVMVNVGFTYFYTYQLFSFSFQDNKLSPYLNLHRYGLLHSVLLGFIGLRTLFFGAFFLDFIVSSSIFYSVPMANKLYPIILNSIFFVGIYMFGGLFFPKRQIGWNYFSAMIGLSTVCLRVASGFFYKLLFNSVRSVELGALSFSFNTYGSQVSVSVFNRLYAGISRGGLQSVLFVAFVLLIPFRLLCAS